MDGPKTVTFHINFGPEIIKNVRYENQTQNSLENLKIAHQVLGKQ
jgi:hypothetical protein